MRIEIENLGIRLGGRDILTGLDLEIDSGISAALVGKSGIGKTTLLRAAAGLIRPTAGTIRIGDSTPQSLYGSAGLAFLFQHAYLWQHLTVRQNLELLYRLHNLPADDARISAQLEAVDLSDAASLYPFQLSAGMKARAAIGRALCRPPKVLLMDEPFAALDPVRRTDLNQKVRKTAQAIGATTLWITHDVVEALMFADRVVVISSPSSVTTFDTRALPPAEDSGYLPECTRVLRDRIIATCWDEGASQPLRRAG